jgi:orotidine-5'-phosphate decarboxylase
MSKKIDKAFIALDNMELKEIFTLLEESKGEIQLIKIGLELFNKYGPSIVSKIYEKYKVDIFLDLKLHDIPNTVFKSIMSLKGLPIKYLTIHLSGGKKMLEMAIKARDESITECKLLGVSFLTSLDKSDLNEIWGITDSNDAFKRLFNLANKAQIDGVICSAQDLEILKSFPNTLLSVCPGIRFQDEIDKGKLSDQKRVLSPKDAFNRGADFLVIGRSITQADNLDTRLNSLKTAHN